jgi:hypothetical protein
MKCRTTPMNIVRKTTWLLVVALSLTIAVGVAFAQVLDSGTVNVQVADRNHSQVDQTTAQGAFVSYFGDSDTTFGSSGTGIFDPFVRLQGSPAEQGYNTNGTTEFNTKVGIWTHAILVSHIPQRPCPDVSQPPLNTPVHSETCFELFNDINENNSTSYISLNKVEVYYTNSATLTGYPFTGSATLKYQFSGDILIHDVNQGSGRADLRYDIPIGTGANQVPLPPNCDFGNPACTTYFVLYSLWGTSSATAPDGNTYASDGGFEEWKVKTYPAITLTKTPSTTNVCNGSNTQVTYTYVVTNTSPGSEAVSGSVLDDNGTPGDTSDDVTIGTFSSLAAGASQTFTHVFTVNGTRTNTVTATATDSNGVSTTATATATVTGHNCTISLTKTPSVTNVCNGSSTSVTYTYVVTNNSDIFKVSGTVTDDIYGSIGSFGPLAPGASATLTKTATVNGTVINIGAASGTFTDAASTNASATATATVTGHTCTISLTKTPSVTNVCNSSNTSVTYTYVVTNNSDFFSVSGTLTDNIYGSIGSFGPLAAGASATLTKTATVNGTVTNIGTASGTFSDSKPTTASATATATVTGHTCTISLTKTPDKTTVCNGSNTQVTYTYVVKNAGDYFNVSGSVTDDNGTPGNTADDVTVGNFTNLGPGVSTTFTHAFTVNGTRTNIATASGTFGDPKPTTASATASATVTGRNCFTGQLTPTSVSCAQYASGTAPTQSAIFYTDDGTGHIAQSINPGVFFYYSHVPLSGSTNVVTVTQFNDGSPGQYNYASTQAQLFNSACTVVATGTTGGTQVSFPNFNATGKAGTYIVGIKYSTKSIVGQPIPTSTGTCDGVPGDVCYTFKTFDNGVLEDTNLSNFILTP